MSMHIVAVNFRPLVNVRLRSTATKLPTECYMYSCVISCTLCQALTIEDIKHATNVFSLVFNLFFTLMDTIMV